MDNHPADTYFAGMPDDQIDLGPHQYSRQDKRTGKMVRDFSPRWARNWMLVSLAILGWVFWNRAAFTVDILFGISAFWAFLAGGFFANWLKDRY